MVISFFSSWVFYLFFSMDDGRLLDYLMNHDELMEEKVAFYIRDTMEALQYLHNCRVAHLDIKVGRKEDEAVHWSSTAPECLGDTVCDLMSLQSK